MLKQQLENNLRNNPFLNLNEAVYNVLYRNIINLTLEPGSSLSETSLAKEFEISRTPIRNALMQLQENGLVIQDKGRAFYVASIKKEDCKQLMEARLAIEGQAAYLAAERFSDEDLSRLKECLAGYLDACKNWNIDEMVHNDHEFHQVIIDASRNSFIKDIYQHLAPRVLHYRYFLFNQAVEDVLVPIMSASARQHQSIYHAIRFGFAITARECIEKDISGMSEIVKNW